MKRKNIALVLMLSLALVVLYGCAANQAPIATATPPVSTATIAATATASPTASPTVQSPASGQLELTIEELAAYDGKNGQPAYIAVDGVIYDVSNDRNWRNGAHEGYTAGKDLTKEIKEASPHGTSVLNRVPVVGKIKQ